MRYVSQQHVHKTVSGPKDKAYTITSFDRASCAVGDAQFEVTLFVIGHVIC